MWQRVEEVVDDIRPLIRSVGIDAEVVDVLERVVTIKLSRTDEDSNPDLVRLRTFVAREIQAELDEVEDVVFEGELAPKKAPASSKPSLTATYEPPEADADTVVLTFGRAVAPPATTVYDSLEVAADRPVILALLRLDGVVSIIGRGDKLIVARASDRGWDTVLPAIDGAIAEAASSAGADAGSLRTRVEAILEKDINPAIAAHGGWIELVDVQGTELYLHMGGGCQGCAQSAATLRMGVEQQIKAAVPEVTAIHDQTDHSAGSNPYFQR